MTIPDNRKTKPSQMERLREIHRYIKRCTENPDNVTFRVTEGFLAGQLDVSERQIRRDIDLLRDRIDTQGVRDHLRTGAHPLRFDHKRRTFYYDPPVDLSVWFGRLDDEDLGALLVAQQALAVFSGMPLAKNVSDIFESDAGGWVGNTRSGLRDEITSLISFHTDGATKLDPVTFATIFRCLLSKTEVIISYQGKEDRAPRERTIRPYHLCCYRQQWRLIAHDKGADALRIFVVTPDRMMTARQGTKTFQRPKDLDPKPLIPAQEKTATEIHLRIAQPGAHFVLERSWMSLASCRKVDGSVEAVFMVRDMGEFKRFVLGFGSDCEVISPADFREQIHAEARMVLKQKRPSKTPSDDSHT